MATEYHTYPGGNKGKVLKVRDDNLLRFIADMEGRHFRTVADTGAGMNALFIWNQVRKLAGLRELELEDLPAYCVICAKYHVHPHKRKEE